MVTFTVPFSHLIDCYTSEYLVANGRELRTTTNRLAQLKKVFLKMERLAEVEADAFFRQYKTAASRNRYRSALSSLIRWGGKRGLVEGTLSLEWERETGERTRRLTKDEEVRLEAKLSAKMRILMWAALDTGLRLGALRQLRIRNMSEGVIHVPAAIQKQKRAQVVPLTKRMRHYLAYQGTDQDQKLFPKWDRREWDRVRTELGIYDLHWHDLRGEFASRLSEAKVDTNVISRLLGHSSLAMTQRYLRPRVSLFQEAIEKLGV